MYILIKGYNMEQNHHDRAVANTAVEEYKAQLVAEAADVTAQAVEDSINGIIEAIGRVKTDVFDGTLTQVRVDRGLGDRPTIEEDAMFELDPNTLELTLANLNRMNTSDSIALASRLRDDFFANNNDTLL